MKRIVMGDEETIGFTNVDHNRPIFAKEGDRLVGMCVLEDEGWILRTGADQGGYGHSDTLEKCIEEGLKYGYEFYVERPK